MTSLRLSAVVAGLMASAVTTSGVEPPLRVGLSHVNIAVADLDRASADYERLGFALKAGRPHDDGIRNRHVKFRDGTEIELITAPAATDSLTTHYRQLISDGDGPAFLALDVEPGTAAVERVAQAGLPASTSGGHVDFTVDGPLGYVFLAGLNQSPTDRPEHFAHRNGASSLVGVTLTAEHLEAERRLFRAFGLEESSCDAVCPSTSSGRTEPTGAGRTEPTGAGRTDRCVVLGDGSVVRLRESRIEGRRRIAALEVRVADTSTATSLLDASQVPFHVDASHRRVTVDGEVTHGVALIFATGAPHDPR